MTTSGLEENMENLWEMIAAPFGDESDDEEELEEQLDEAYDKFSFEDGGDCSMETEKINPNKSKKLDFRERIVRYQDVLQSNKYADSNSEPVAIQRLLNKVLYPFLHEESLSDAHNLQTVADGSRQVNGASLSEIRNIGFVQEQLKLEDDRVNDRYVPAPQVSRFSRFSSIRLGKYQIPRDYFLFLGCDAELLLIRELTQTNYIDFFRRLLFLEEAHQVTEMRKYDMKDIYVSKHEMNSYKLAVEGLAEGKPSLINGDYLYLVNNIRDSRFEGLITDVREKDIIFELKNTISPHEVLGQKFDAQFVQSRIQFRRCHWTIEHYDPNITHYKNLLYPSENLSLDPPSALPAIDLDPMASMKFYNTSLNEYQKKAVCNMLRNVYRPTPYIVFGPPGTGKTVTIVEAIIQVYKWKPHWKILACCNSNSSTDLIAELLLKSGEIHEGHILRLCAHHRLNDKKLNTIPDTIRDINIEAENISEMNFFQTKIIVTTCMQAFHLHYSNRGVFDFVFIDEAGKATEPEAMVCLELMKKEGSVVIAGDPYQLGPVVFSEPAKQGGLGKSLLERLHERLVRRSTDEVSNFDPKFITKLMICYRSDPRVMQISNSMFYDNELIFQTTTPERVLKSIGTEYPLVFCEIRGKEKREFTKPSWFNPNELVTALMFLRKLYMSNFKTEQIGIISPYRMQLKKMKDMIAETKLPLCKVGTMEEFQGLERDIIIISTVRTQSKYLTMDKKFGLGFIQDKKRFNVGVSRAKWLTIVVGHPELLSQDECWSKYINVCKLNDSYFDGTKKRQIDDTTSTVAYDSDN